MNLRSSPPPGRQHHHPHLPSCHPSLLPPCNSARRAPGAALPAWAETEHVVCSPKPLDESSLIFKQPDRHDGRPGRGRQESNRMITDRARGGALDHEASRDARWPIFRANMVLELISARMLVACRSAHFVGASRQDAAAAPLSKNLLPSDNFRSRVKARKKRKKSPA